MKRIQWSVPLGSYIIFHFFDENDLGQFCILLSTYDISHVSISIHSLDPIFKDENIKKRRKTSLILFLRKSSSYFSAFSTRRSTMREKAITPKCFFIWLPRKHPKGNWGSLLEKCSWLYFLQCIFLNGSQRLI